MVYRADALKNDAGICGIGEAAVSAINIYAGLKLLRSTRANGTSNGQIGDSQPDENSGGGNSGSSSGFGAAISPTVRANASVSKFRDFIFRPGAAPGKDVVFRNLGYDIQYSELLASIYEEQALMKYLNNEYTLGKLDYYGQRINIEIELLGIGEFAGKTSYLRSGWMIRTNEITLNTPFTGFTR